MAVRTRQLKHGFFLNEDLAVLDPLTRLLFAGLWLLADRDGRLEDRPTRIKAQLFPYHEANVDSMLAELVPGGFVRRYEVGGVKYIEIPNFTEHQHVHKDEKSSIIPPGPEIPGNPRKSPEIPPCTTDCTDSPSSSPSFSPSPSLTVTVDGFNGGNLNDNKALLDMPMPWGKEYKGVRIINVPVEYCEWALSQNNPHRGSIKKNLERALRLRIGLKKDDMTPQQQKPSRGRHEQ